MKLIMTGGGESEHFEKIDQLFINQLGENPALLFIPLAGKKSTWKNGLERIQSVFSTIHFQNIEMCIDLTQLDWDYLNQFSAIYFDGGNTFNLMEQIRETHTFELLHRFLHNGKIINGDSAGAIVLGSHLETAHFGENGDTNRTSITSYQGLNLIGKWAIHCHYEESEDQEIKTFSETYGFPIIALHETSSIFIEGSRLKVVGPEKIKVFQNSKTREVHPGSYFQLN